MPAIETAIWLALRARVEALTLNPVHPVSWPNESFTKPLTGYLRVTWIPNINRRLFVKGSDPHQRLSLLQVDVFEKMNADIAIAMELAGKVAAHFPADFVMAAHGARARVQRAPEVAQAIPDDTHIMIPVTVPIEVFA